MAERRKPRRRNDSEDTKVVSKEEYAVAKHVRFNIMAHEGKLAGMSVKCFIASDAIDCMMDSKWAKGKSNNPDSEIFFKDRLSCQTFFQRLLSKGLFHRADKKERKKEKDKIKKKKKDSVESAEKSKKDKKSKTDLEKEGEKTAEKEEKKEEKREEDKKTTKPRKYKLGMSEDQRFLDGNNIYVWIFDPIHPKTFSIGLLMVLGAVALCLFPLWPDWMRIGVYYISLLGAAFVGLMLFLIVFRVILFCMIWIVTLGKHHFWFFPNLTEDVGILDSFRPIYTHEVYPAPKKEEKEIKKKEKENEEVEKKDSEESGSEGNNIQNGFEMVDTNDVENDNMDESLDNIGNVDDEDGSGLDDNEDEFEDEDKKEK